jgi:hypothetical protein
MGSCLLYLRSFNRFILINLALLGFSISSASAALTSADWLSVGDEKLTIDDSGLQWLDLSETAGQSYNAVAAQLVAGGLFEDFRYATAAEVEGLWDSAGGDDRFYDGWSAENNGVFDVLAPYWGDSYCIDKGCATGTGYASTLIDQVTQSGKHASWMIYDLWSDFRTANWDRLARFNGNHADASSSKDRASALVRKNSVPVPGLTCTTTQIDPGGEEFKGISGNSDSNVIAVGINGSIYHYDGTTWVKNIFSAGIELRDVVVIASGEAWAVGNSGKVVQYDGTVWTTLLAPTGQDLQGVWAISDTEVWVVGTQNSLYLWNGVSWTDMSGAGQANVDAGQELRDAWGDSSYFYTVEEDGDLYRYTRTGGPWNKFNACNALGDIDIEDIWGDGTGNIYLAGKDNMGPGNGDNEGAVFLYNEATNSCSKIYTTTSKDQLDGISGNGGIVYAVGTKGLVAENTTGSWAESTQGKDDFKDVWVSNTNTAYYAGEIGSITVCNNNSGTAVVDHFVITPTFSPTASTCLANAITIEARNADDDPAVDYVNLVNITVQSRNHGNWSKDITASGVLNPDPDTDDNGAVTYTFSLLDSSSVVLNLTNTHAETVFVRVNDPAESVTTDSGNITFSENTLVVTEDDALQIAGKPKPMKITMVTDDTAGSGSCGRDPNYNSANQDLEVDIIRSVPDDPGGSAPLISGLVLPDTISFDFSGTQPGELAGQASFNLLSTDVGKYRLDVLDQTSNHSNLNIITGSSPELTMRPFGIAVTNITGLIANPGNTTSAGAVFALAGTDFSATVEAVLWDSNDDTNNDGVLDTGVYWDNQKAPGYAWATTLGVPSPAMGFTPTVGLNGVQGSFINGALIGGDFTTGTASPTNLQYDEVGSFTLQSSATGYLGTIGADFVGDDIIVGRFRPASFALTSTVNGMFANSCTPPGLSPYTYIGESFTYDVIHPAFVVTAMNGLAASTPTTNYTGDWGKLNDDSVNFTQPAADLTQDGSDGSTKMAISYTQDAAKFTITDNTNGSFTFEFADDSYVYDKDSNSEIPDFDSDITLAVVDVTDLETVTYNTAFNLNPTFINLRFGRVRMSNAHGSEISVLAMPMLVEYLDSPGLYTINIDDDGCTTIANANLGLSDNLSTPGSSTVTVTNPAAVAGNLGVSLTAPGAGITGYIDVTPDLNASTNSWLQYDWTFGAGTFTENPTGRATFGIYTGNDVNIYKSQTYQ